MKQKKLLLPGFLLIIAAGYSDHEHSDLGDSHGNAASNHDSI